MKEGQSKKRILKSGKDRTDTAVYVLLKYGVTDDADVAQKLVQSNDEVLFPSDLSYYTDQVDQDLGMGKTTPEVVKIRNALAEFYGLYEPEEETEEEIPSELDDLLGSIREEELVEPEAPPSSALAIYEGVGGDDLVDEEIDERILKLLKLDDVFDIDYATYMTLLKERMVSARMPDSSISTEEDELLREEFKRVKGKVGRFKLKKKKITAEDLGETGPVSVSDDKFFLASAAVIPNKSVDPEAAEDNSEVLKKLDDILSSLRMENKEEKKKTKSDKKDAAEENRRKREKKIESNKRKEIKSLITTVIAPVTNIMQDIINWFKWTFIGFLFNQVLGWFKDPQNKEKVEALGNFIKTFWPAILAAATLFLTPFGAFIRSTIKLLRWAIPKMFGIIKKHPRIAGAAALLGAGLLVPQFFPETVNEQERKTKEAAGTKEEKIAALKKQKENLNPLQIIQGVGAEIDDQIKFLETGQTAQYGAAPLGSNNSALKIDEENADLSEMPDVLSQFQDIEGMSGGGLVGGNLVNNFFDIGNYGQGMGFNEGGIVHNRGGSYNNYTTLGSEGSFQPMFGFTGGGMILPDVNVPKMNAKINLFSGGGLIGGNRSLTANTFNGGGRVTNSSLTTNMFNGGNRSLTTNTFNGGNRSLTANTFNGGGRVTKSSLTTNMFNGGGLIGGNNLTTNMFNGGGLIGGNNLTTNMFNGGGLIGGNNLTTNMFNGGGLIGGNNLTTNTFNGGGRVTNSSLTTNMFNGGGRVTNSSLTTNTFNGGGLIGGNRSLTTNMFNGGGLIGGNNLTTNTFNGGGLIGGNRSLTTNMFNGGGLIGGNNLTTNTFNGGGRVTNSALNVNDIRFEGGGSITNNSGVNITGAGPDTQLIAAKPGEIVMSTEAVNHWGANTLLGMNKAGGGTNVPKMANNIQLAAGGGMVGAKSAPLSSGGSTSLDPTKTAASMPHVFEAAKAAREKARAEGLSPEEIERKVIQASEQAKAAGPNITPSASFGSAESPFHGPPTLDDSDYSYQESSTQPVSSGPKYSVPGPIVEDSENMKISSKTVEKNYLKKLVRNGFKSSSSYDVSMNILPSIITSDDIGMSKLPVGTPSLSKIVGSKPTTKFKSGNLNKALTGIKPGAWKKDRSISQKKNNLDIELKMDVSPAMSPVNTPIGNTKPNIIQLPTKTSSESPPPENVSSSPDIPKFSPIRNSSKRQSAMVALGISDLLG